MLGRPRMIRKNDPKIFRTCMKKKYNWPVFNNKINHMDEIGISTKEHCISGSIQYTQSRPSSFKGQHCYKNSQLINNSDGKLTEWRSYSHPLGSTRVKSAMLIKISMDEVVKERGGFLRPVVNRYYSKATKWRDGTSWPLLCLRYQEVLFAPLPEVLFPPRDSRSKVPANCPFIRAVNFMAENQPLEHQYS